MEDSSLREADCRSASQKSPTLAETEGSLMCSHESSPHTQISFLNIHFNIIPNLHMSPKWYFSLKFSNYAYYMSLHSDK
jgi:hypothetical protein